MNSAPLVSVLLPVYNGARYLPEAIDSILQQTFTDFELIVINDGSTDETPSILNSYSDPRLRVFHQENQKLTATLNRGLAVARGNYIARQDADDVSLPERFAQQVKLLEAEPEVVILGSGYYLIDETGAIRRTDAYPSKDTAIRWQMLFYNSFAHTAVMLRANTLRAHGLRYNAHTLHAEDYDLWSHLLCFGKGRNLDRPLVKHRMHSRQISQMYADYQRTVADQIAAANISRLGVAVGSQVVCTLRDWYYAFPSVLIGHDLAACQNLLEILDAFAKQPALDVQAVRVLRRNYAEKILRSTWATPWAEIWTSGILASLLRQAPAQVLRYLSQRVSLRLGRAFRGR